MKQAMNEAAGEMKQPFKIEPWLVLLKLRRAQSAFSLECGVVVNISATAAAHLADSDGRRELSAMEFHGYAHRGTDSRGRETAHPRARHGADVYAKSVRRHLPVIG